MDSQNTNTARENPIGKPGYTGNPGGRPKMPEKYRELFRGKLTDLSLKVLEDVLSGVDEDAKTSDRVRCVEIALDRAWGKPVQAVDLDPNETGALPSIKIEFVKPDAGNQVP